MNENIFRAYDIRGNSKLDLDDLTITKIACVLGARIANNGHRSVYIGHDSRLSASRIFKALCVGFNSVGIKVLDIGLVPTPLVYYATKVGESPNGVMITGSHNPKDDNGLKMVINDDAVSGTELLDEVRALGSFQEGNQNIEKIDLISKYLDEVGKLIEIEEPIKVVLDSGNGAAGEVAHQIFTKLGIDTHSIYREPDGNFPNHHPDPSKEKNLTDLKKVVLEHNADVGFAFDGDGDRVGMITNDGQSVLADHLIMLLSRFYLEQKKGSIVYDVKCSSQLPKLIIDHGGMPIMEKTGHFNIKRTIKDKQAILGGEMSGHIFINHNWYGFDDAIFTATVLSKIIAQSKQTASEIIHEFPKTFSTPELNLEVDDSNKFKMVDDFIEGHDIHDAEINTIDGIRITIGTAWGLLRASNTSPKLVFRFEAETQEDLNMIKGRFESNLKRIFPELELAFD